MNSERPPVVTARAAHDLAGITGIDCSALSMDSDVVTSGGGCCICDTILRGHVAPTAADTTHRFAAYQSERLGGRYLYTCSYTLLHAASPVLEDDSIASVLVCGPVVLGTVDDQILESIRDSKVASMMSRDAALAWVNSLPQLGPGEATALSETLARVAISCCDRAGAESLLDAVGREDGNNLAEYVDYLTSMEGDKRSSMQYPVEKERALMDRVSAGDREGAEALLVEVVDAVNAYEVRSPEEARSRVLELVVLISRAAIAGGADIEQVFGLEYRSLDRLRSLGSIDEISAWLSRILRRFLDLVFDLRNVRFSAHLSKALAFIRNHFRDSISLGDAAAAAGISPGYLGRILRTELHSSFTKYVLTVRIAEAKRLLKRTRMPVGEIGARCGFLDHSYFTQVFRRQVGISPSEYREGIAAS